MIEELPEESTEPDQSAPAVKNAKPEPKSILLKDDETPPKKNVTFDNDKTTVKEFFKNEKIANKAPAKRKDTGQHPGKGKNKEEAAAVAEAERPDEEAIEEEVKSV